MDTASLPAKISRVDKRFRHWTQDLTTRTIVARDLKKEGEKEGESVDDELERANMGRHHAIFHRRQATAVLTVNVEVINSVDSNGSIIAQQTVTSNSDQVNAAAATTTSAGVPTVPAVPTNGVPTVPSVPAFPSDLTVPAYPFTSSALTTATSSQIVISSSATTTGAALPSPLPSSGYNSTTSSTIMSSTSVSSSINSTTSSSQPSSTKSSSSSITLSSSSSSLSSSSASAFLSSSSASSVEGFIGGGGATGTAAAPGATTSAALSNDSSGSGSLGTPAVVGTIFGSLAGAALILALILFLLRRHKQKQRTTAQIAGDDHADNQPMTQAAARTSYLAPSFLNRFSGASRSTTETASTGERGFQRISGRKLPSAFSEGMTSEQFAREGTLSGSSFYKDDKGIYGGPGVTSKDFAVGALGKEMGGGAFGKETGGGAFDKETGGSAGVGAMGTKERVMPGPARTPVVFHPEEVSEGTTLSPPLTPNPDYPPTRGTLGRSHPSQDGSRSSRFTENV